MQTAGRLTAVRMDDHKAAELAWKTPVGELYALPAEVLAHPAFIDAILDGPGAGRMHLAKDADWHVLQKIRTRLHERAANEPRLREFLEFYRNPPDPYDELCSGLSVYL